MYEPHIADFTEDCVILQVFSSGTIYVYRNMFREDRDFQLEAVAEHTNEGDLKSAPIDRNSLKFLKRNPNEDKSYSYLVWALSFFVNPG